MASPLDDTTQFFPSSIYVWHREWLIPHWKVGVNKKIKKLIKPRKPEKNNWNNRTVKKNRLNRFKFWKNRPVRFYKPETEKTKLNRTQNEKNWEKTTLISLSIHPHLMNKHTSLIVFRNKNHRRRSIMKYYYSFLEN